MRTLDRRRSYRLVALGLATALAAGCAGEADGRRAGETNGRAAEPAPAPSPAEAPAGRVVELPSAAEGIVADPSTHIVAVGVRNPPALVLVDGRSGRVRRRVELPGHLRHLQLQAPGGPVLVPLEDADRLVRVDLPSGKIGDSVPTGKHPHDATAAGNGAVFVADEFGKAVSVVRGEKVVHTFRDVAQPGGIAAAGNLVGLVDVRDNTLTVYDAERLVQVARVDAGSGPTHTVADRRGRLVVIDTRGEAILVFALRPTVRLVSRTPLPGHPYGVAYDTRRDRLWVTLTGRNQLVGLDFGAGGPREAVRLPTVRQPNTVAVDATSGLVFVTGRADGDLQIAPRNP
ncbi:MAG: YncE family protein [Streptosporangiales bacterium]|nr:YncE family protein [Streptosporangiales bacterium]